MTYWSQSSCRGDSRGPQDHRIKGGSFPPLHTQPSPSPLSAMASRSYPPNQQPHLTLSPFSSISSSPVAPHPPVTPGASPLISSSSAPVPHLFSTHGHQNASIAPLFPGSGPLRASLCSKIRFPPFKATRTGVTWPPEALNLPLPGWVDLSLPFKLVGFPRPRSENLLRSLIPNLN